MTHWVNHEHGGDFPKFMQIFLFLTFASCYYYYYLAGCNPYLWWTGQFILLACGLFYRDSHFTNQRFPFCKLQISILQTINIFPFHKLQISILQIISIFPCHNYRFSFNIVLKTTLSPLTPKISSVHVILVTVCHTVLVMLVRRIWC